MFDPPKPQLTFDIFRLSNSDAGSTSAKGMYKFFVDNSLANAKCIQSKVDTIYQIFFYFLFLLPKRTCIYLHGLNVTFNLLFFPQLQIFFFVSFRKQLTRYVAFLMNQGGVGNIRKSLLL